MTTSLKAQAVVVLSGDAAEQIEGAVIAGVLIEGADPQRPRFDLGEPFCVQTDDGKVWVRRPWACDIEEC
jgi:hypothetical protein